MEKIFSAPGLQIYRAGEDIIQFGMPSEGHKYMMEQAMDLFPNYYVSTDIEYICGVNYFDVEAYFINAMFNCGGIDMESMEIKRRIKIIGERNIKKRVEKILELTVNGIPDEMLNRVPGLSAKMKQILTRQRDFFRIKKDGVPIPLKLCYGCGYWNKDRSYNISRDVKIVKTGPAEFELWEGENRVEVDLTNSELKPAWEVPVEYNIPMSHGFCVKILGSSGPFHLGPSSSYLVLINNQLFLIDCAPFTHLIFNSLGYTSQQLEGIFITHVHGDHDGGLPWFGLESDRKITIYTTREIWEMEIEKLCATLNRNRAEIEGMYRFHEINVGQTLNLAGAKLDFHYTSHPLPTISVDLRKDGRMFRITSDTAGPNTIRAMYKNKIIDKNRHDELLGLFSGEQVIADAGESIIHPSPEELMGYMGGQDTSLYLGHRTAPVDIAKGITVDAIKPLQLFQLEYAELTVDDTILIRNVLEMLKVRDIETWTKTMAHGRHVEIVSPGQEIIHQGSTNLDYLYIISHGRYAVLVDNELIEVLTQGSLFGEQGLLTKRKRNASVYALTPGVLIKISSEIFNNLFASEEQLSKKQSGIVSLQDRLEMIWNRRMAISKADIFGDVSAEVKSRLALEFEQVKLPPNHKLVNRAGGVLYIITKGKLEAKLPDKTSIIMKPYSVVGEINIANHKLKMGSVKTLSSVELLGLPQAQFKKFVEEDPKIREELRRMVKDRKNGLWRSAYSRK